MLIFYLKNGFFAMKMIKKTDRQKIKDLLVSKGQKQQDLFLLAQKTKEKVFQNRIHFRGIIEFSNFCQNDCFYCGIRKSTQKIKRYQMSLEEIKKTLAFIHQAGYGSVVFQSGEKKTSTAKKYLLDIIKLTHKIYPQLGITISSGEHSFEFYQALRLAGADRYLLRIETSNATLYKKLHPTSMSFENRLQCLTWLKELNFQVGSGIMIGLPGQTIDDLTNDLIFFLEKQFDMYGLGPYVIHQNTPLSSPLVQENWQKNKKQIYNLTLNFLALLRIFSPKVNIAAATALDVFDPKGRLQALKIAANVIMPIVTPQKYRKDYSLYEKKSYIDEEALQCKNCLINKIKKQKLKPVFNEQGLSPFYLERTYG